MKQKTIGVLAFQGGVKEHQEIIEKLSHKFQPVLTLKDLEKVDVLIIPGGESTTIGFFLEESGLMEAIKKRAKKGMPLFGTCAGAIILAKEIKSSVPVPHLGLMDMTIERNAYGTQIESFYADLSLRAESEAIPLESSEVALVASLPRNDLKRIKAAFIRAPIIQKLDPSVKILATYQKKPVLVQQGNLFASTFHPELRNDSQLHRYFIEYSKTSSAF